MATWWDEAQGWGERTGRDVRRKGEELRQTYRPMVDQAVAAGEAKLQAHRSALKKGRLVGGPRKSSEKGGAWRAKSEAASAAARPRGGEGGRDRNIRQN